MIKNLVADEWNYPSNRIDLGNDELHIWRASLDQNMTTTLKLSALLALDERQRAEKYLRSADRDQFIIARGILRKILSTYLHLTPCDLRFVYNEYGKPFLSLDQNCCALNFNLSHSNSVALYAVTRGRRVGVDIEYIREDFATLDIAESFFSIDEVISLKAAPATCRTKAFFNCWTRKESYIKAVGMGVSYPLDGFTVSLDPTFAPALLKAAADEREPTHWQMYELNVAEGYVASLIVENPPVALKQYQWLG